MPAELIWDNADPKTLKVPERMGKPAAHQLQGSPLDNLAELAGRVCYDSLGAEKSRSSVEYHQHIRDVRHLSVYRHCTFTASLYCNSSIFLNRVGVHVRRDDPSDTLARLRVSLNLQHVLEWCRPLPVDRRASLDAAYYGTRLAGAARSLAPLAMAGAEGDLSGWDDHVKIVPPETPEERWLSFYIHGVSRGLTHELVRHGAYTAPSQRSTRYCDETDATWIPHPLIRDTFRPDAPEEIDRAIHADLVSLQEDCSSLYEDVVNRLTALGHDRKQARGAARGWLGNALETELVFSASLARWREIHALRNHPAADLEIRELFAQIGELLPAA